MVSFEKTVEVIGAYKSGRCDAYAAWELAIAVLVANQFEDADDHAILGDKLTAEPISAAMRQGDEESVDVVNWMLAAMGNFGEICDRNLGEGSPYKLERGLNNLWSEGGVLYSPILD